MVPDSRTIAVSCLAAGAVALLPTEAAPLLAAFVVAWAAAPLAARFALQHGATTPPGGRSIHATPTPLLGGLAVLAPVLAVLLLAGDARSLGLAAACALLAAVGAADDLRDLSPRAKLAAQIGAAGILLATGWRIEGVHLPPFLDAQLDPAAGAFLLVGWIVLATNAINLIDGLDGLAGGTAFVAAFAAALAGAGPAAAALCGALLGFLRHNLPTARVFLGDTGSMPVGLLCGALLLDVSGGWNAPLALGALALPLGDVLLSFARRWLRGKPVFRGDRGHVHHHLLRLCRSPGLALAALLAFSAVQAAFVLDAPDAYGLARVTALWALLVVLLLVVARSRWNGIVAERRRFQRLHVARRHAEESLRLAEREEDVRGALERLAEDLDLFRIEVRGIRVARAEGGAGAVVEERVPCDGGTAVWRHAADDENGVFAEERRTIVCEILRRADARLDSLRAPKAEAGFGLARPAAHLLAADAADLERLAPLALRMRRRGAVDPVVVHAARRDALESRVLSAIPDVDLDVEPGPDAVAEVVERYSALVAAAAPALVVVLGDSDVAVAGTLVAKARGVAVVHFDGALPLLGDVVADLLAAVELSAGRRRLVPALEALMRQGAPA